jgi:hypothetical protein
MRPNERRKIEWGMAAQSSSSADVMFPNEPARGLPQPVLDSLPVAQERNRSRDWERQHRGVTYRGVQRELLVQLQEVASELNVVTDDVARAFLEYGLSAYRDGKLILIPRPWGIRMTLYPKAGLQAAQRTKGHRSKNKARAPWESRATFRSLPCELKEGVGQAADDLCVPIGEIAVAFFHYALEAYQDGLLTLNPHPKAVLMTLFGV